MIALAPTVVRLISAFHETVLLLIAMHDRIKNAPGAKATCDYARKNGARQQLHDFMGLCRLCAPQQVAPAGPQSRPDRLLSRQASASFTRWPIPRDDGGQAVHERGSVWFRVFRAKPYVIRRCRLFQKGEKRLFTPVDKTVHRGSRAARSPRTRGCAAIRARMLHFSLMARPSRAMRSLVMPGASHHGRAHGYASRLSTETTCKLFICA